jgi:prepilin-type N-terminal cleavage/methylation domain-containing protein
MPLRLCRPSSRAPRPARLGGADAARTVASHRTCRRDAFTLVELLVVMGIIAVVVSILIPVMHRARAASQAVTCLSNLRQVSVAFHLFAERNDKRFPDPSITRVSWETSLSPYTSTNVFACPADNEIFPSVGSSYDWRDTPSPATTLAGKTLTDSARSSLVLAFEALPGWHARKRINAAFLDGTAQDMDYETCLTDLEKANNLSH